MAEVGAELRRAALARLARRAREPRAEVIPRAPRGEPLRASFAQERMWFLEQLEAGATTNQLPIGLHLRGPLDVPALERALAELVRRHESLRTALVLGEDGLRQVVRPPRLALSRADVRGSVDAAARARELALLDARRPFDLAAGELLRALLVHVGPERHLLLFHVHHVAADAWSMGVLFGELSALYGAFRQGAHSPLPEPALQHADCAAWQRARHEAGALAAELAYWRERLAGAPDVLELPRSQGVGRPSGPARVPLALDGAALESFGRAQGATLFMVLLAGFSLLLARWSGERDLLVGTPVANRGRPELTGVVGLLLNSLVLRCDLAGDPTVAGLLARARETTAQAFAHAEAPFEQVVEALQPERDLGRRPIFQAMLDLYDAPPDRLRLDGLEVEVESFRTAVDFDLAMIAMRSAGGLSAALEYDPARYDAAMVQRLAAHLTRLLEALPEDPERRVSRLPMLTGAEREELEGWGAGEEREGGEGCVHRWFERVAGERGEGEAVRAGEESLSYRELDEASNRLARWLRGRGVGPEVRVGIEVGRGVELVEALLGVMKAGGVCVPLDQEYPAARLEQMREAAGVEVVVRDVGEAEAESSEAVESGVGPEHLCYVLFTSGSTGRPKGVGYRHGGLSNLVSWHLGELLGGARTLGYASMSFDACFHEVFSALCGGGVVVLASEEERRDVRELGRLVREGGVEKATLPPVLLEQLAGEVEGWGEWAGLREVTATGERLVVTPELRRLFGAIQPCRLENQMGPTETHVVVGCELAGEPAEWEALPAIGRPVANTQVYVLDSELELVARGVWGELCIAGVQLARGYLGQPGQTAERFVPNPLGPSGSRLYRSGDRCRWRGDGQLEYLGRGDEQVKVRGQRVELGEVEAVLREHPGVREAVAGVRGEGVERRLVAWVVGEAGAEELRGWLGERLPEAMVPQLWVELEGLPVTASGKVDRRLLPEPEVASRAEYVGPRTREEEVLAGIWGEVLGAERVGVHDNYFELGGDSILSILIATRARRAGLALTPRHLFRHQTVAELAAAVAPLPTDPTGDLPLLPLARDLLTAGLQQERLLVELAEPLPPDLLQRALAAVAAHHDALRLSAAPQDGGWRLAVGPDPSPLLEAEPDGGRLRMALPELAAGAASWSLLLADLETAAAQLRAGLAVELPAPTASLRAWSQRVAALAADPALAADADFWAARSRLEVARLPLASPGGVRPAAVIRAGLPAGDSAAVLDELPSVYPLEPSELLLAALSAALHAWTGGSAALVEVEAPARSAPLPAEATARTLGRLACRFPLRLPLVPAERPGELLRAVKAEARAVPNGGLGHGLLRDLGPSPAVRERLAAAPRPALGFAWLGEIAPSPGGTLRPVTWEPPGRLAGRALEVTGLRLDGRLELCLRFAADVVPAGTAQALADGILAALRALAEHCLSGAESGYTAADFPDAGITDAELEALLRALGEEDPAT